MATRRERGLHELVRFVGPSLALRPLLTLAVSILVARTLGPEGRGAYGVAVTAIAVLPLIGSLGFEYAVRYWSARGEVDTGSLLRSVNALGLLAGLFIAGVGAVCVWLRSPSWLVPESIGPLGGVAFSICLGLTLLRAFWSNFLVGLERYAYATWGTNLAMVLQVGVLLAWWQLAGMSLDAALGAFAVQMILSFVLFFAFAPGELARSLRAPFLDLGELRGMLRFGLWEWLGELLTQTNVRLNIFLLAALGGLYETGLYTAVIGPANFLLLLASPLNLVLSARTARRGDDLEFPGRVAGALRLVFVVSALPALAAAAVADPLLPLVFGERFVDAAPPFRLLMPGIVAVGLVRIMAQYLSGAGRPDWNMRIAAVGAVLTVALNVILIPRHGASGAAAATTLAGLATVAVSTFAFLRVSGLPGRRLVAFRRSDWTPLGRVLGLGAARNPSP